MTRTEILQFISHIDGWLSMHEGFFLYEAVKNRKGKGEVVEIGSWKGKSTICLAAGLRSLKKGKLFAIDPHKGQYTKNNHIGKKSPTFKKFQENVRKAGLLSFVNPIIATSQKAAKDWEKPIRLLFIDGLHDYKNTKLDFSSWSPFLKTNGIVALHDAFCGHDGPERVVQEELLSSDLWSNIGVVGSIIFAEKKKATTFIEQCNLFRHRLLIPLAIQINKKNIPNFLKFFIIHRALKLFLINSYTWNLLRHEKI